MADSLLDQNLVSRFRNRECIFFIGAGVSNASGLKTGQQFRDQLTNQISYPWNESPLGKVAQAYEDVNDRPSLIAEVNREFGDRGKVPAPAHDLVAELAAGYCSHIITTNYDGLLERALENQHRPFHVSKTDKQVSLAESKLHLVKLHGSVDDPESIVLTDGDYRNLFSTRPILRNILGGLLAQKTFIFIGYSLEDSDFDQIYHRITLTMGEFQHLSYAIQRKPGSISDSDWQRFQVDPWGRRKIRIITADQVNALTELRQKLKESPLAVSPPERLVGSTALKENQERKLGDINRSLWYRLETEDLLNCRVEVECKIEMERALDDWFGIRVRGTTNYFHSGYLIYVRSSGSLDVTSIEERSILTSEKSIVSPRDGWVKLAAEIIGDQITVYVNDEQVVDVHNALVSWPGKIFLHTWETVVRIRSIVVTK